MKNFYLTLLFVVFTWLGANAQITYGNEWIDYNQQYYKFPVVKNGIYRIDSTALANAGIPISTINPRNLQLFGRSKQVAVYVYGEDDNVFNGTDYIEFYGEMNDGWMDTELYDGPGQRQTNPYWSLYSDTAYYFISWNQTGNNLRFTPIAWQSNSYTAAPYFIREYVDIRDNRPAVETWRYNFGRLNSINGTDPDYIDGEGWCSGRVQAPNGLVTGSGAPAALPTANAVTNVGIDAQYTFCFVTASNDISGSPNHRFKLRFANSAQLDSSYTGYQMLKWTINVPAANLGGTTTQAQWEYYRPAPVTTASSRRVFQRLTYPHNYNLENATSYTMYVPDAPSNGGYRLDITNFNGTPILYDLTDNKRIDLNQSGGTFQAIAQNGSAGDNKYYIAATSTIQNITADKIKPVSEDPLNYARFTDYTNVVKDRNFLIVTHKKLRNEANDYMAYKNTTGYTALVLDIDELNDQFAAGIKKTPLGMRHFAHYALDNWTVKPEYLLLIGKSVEPTFWRNGNQAGASYDPYNDNMIPSVGYPPSDNLITAYINGSGPGQTLATGRISTTDPANVTMYLNKLSEYESNPPAEWMKNVLHFAGGESQNGVNQILNYLDNFKAIMEDTLYGANVRTFSKSTPDPIDISLADSITTLINLGTSLMNFFGHAAGSSFDIAVDDPSTFSNAGKYPIVLANSCFAGDIHQPEGYINCVSENFVFQQQKGAIAFIASVTQGVTPYLNSYSRRLIENISWRMYNKPVGKAMQEVGANYVLNNDVTNEFIKGTMLEMTLGGDPSIVMNSFEHPDYMLSEQGVYFNPGDVTSSLDSFDINIVATNLARAINDTVLIQLTRKFPDNSDTTYIIPVPNLYYKDTFSLTLPVDPIKGIGLNEFTVRIDYTQLVTEMDEMNNTVMVPLNIRSTAISPIYPYDYAIVPSGQLTLKGSTFDPYAPSATYRLQVDTTDLFTAPLINITVTQTGGVVNFPVNLTLPDSTVYFWRISPDSVPGISGYTWKESSFQVIQGLTGWSQDHFFQFKNDGFSFLNYNRTNRLFELLSGYKTLSAYNQMFCNECYGIFPTILYKIDADVQDYDGYDIPPAIHIAVIDSLTLQPWGTKWTDNSTTPPVVYNPNRAYGQINGDGVARNRVENYFIWRPYRGTSNSQQQQGLVQTNNMLNFLRQIPQSAYVLAYSWNRTMFDFSANWGTIRQYFADSLHATDIFNVPDTSAWIFFGKKNDPSVAQQLFDTTGQMINLQAQLPTDRPDGSITSTKIGPAQAWNTFKWKVATNADTQRDTIKVKIIGVKANGQEDVLMSNIYPAQDSIDLSNFVNASVYPYLKLNCYVFDDSLKTPLQLDRWQVFYSPYPEFALNPTLYNKLDSTKLQEGEDVGFWVAAENVTPYSLPAGDSLKVDWWIIKSNNAHVDLPSQIIAPIAPNSWDTLRLSNTTIGYGGINTIWTELNPFGQGHRTEQFHFNNYSQRNFEVGGDRINPLLDVTFDGIHIMDGDIVSSKPQIMITLKDENKFLALDTTSFKIFLTDPAGNQLPVYYITGQGQLVLDFTPPNLPHNNAKIMWAPIFTLDGKYQLLVQAKDKSGNSSGKNDYRISFEVINKSTITNVMNYPNPFSTQTKFVFTLTGSETPDYFKIQILTITGKVVREITQDEIGPIRIGRNITDYAWDGRDEFGDQLANGVYLYRVVTKISGESIEKRETSADSYFKHGFGKMYLMR